MAIPPDFPLWDRLRDRYCKGDYSHVEIYTDTTKNVGTHMLFNCQRLTPGNNKPELLSQSGDYSAKHINDNRRDEWPNTIWVDSATFKTEVEKRSNQLDLPDMDEFTRTWGNEQPTEEPF
jgi:hypothetical protein